MARERSPNRDKAKELYLSAKGDIKLTDIAAQLSVSDSLIRKWKSSDKWDSELNGALPINKSNVTNRKSAKSKKKEPIAKEVEDVIESDGLTEKQRLFCIYYIENFNATKSYQKAYKCDYTTANAHGYKMLSNVVIKAEIERLTDECLQEEKINSKLISKRVLQKYIAIAFADITDYLSFGRRQIETANGPKVVNYVDLQSSSEVDGTIITEVSQGKDGVKVKLADKMRALDFLAKNMGLLSLDVKEKLEMEREKLAIMKRKDASDDEEIEDDGFIAALSGQVESVWDDEEEN